MFTTGGTQQQFKDICRLCLENANTFNPLLPLFSQNNRFGRLAGKESNESIPHILTENIGLKV